MTAGRCRSTWRRSAAPSWCSTTWPRYMNLTTAGWCRSATCRHRPAGRRSRSSGTSASPHWTQPAADTPTKCSATRHRHSWRRSRSPGSRSKTPWPTAKPLVTTTTAARQLSMHKVSNGRPWPAIRFLILFRRTLFSAPPTRIARRANRNSSGALWLVRYELELVGHSAELGKRTGLHLLHRPAAVHLHGGFGDADIVGNLFAQAATRDLDHHLALPGT